MHASATTEDFLSSVGEIERRAGTDSRQRWNQWCAQSLYFFRVRESSAWKQCLKAVLESSAWKQCVKAGTDSRQHWMVRKESLFLSRAWKQCVKAVFCFFHVTGSFCGSFCVWASRRNSWSSSVTCIFRWTCCAMRLQQATYFQGPSWHLPPPLCDNFGG